MAPSAARPNLPSGFEDLADTSQKPGSFEASKHGHGYGETCALVGIHYVFASGKRLRETFVLSVF